MTTFERHAWLYIRGEQSVYIVVGPMTLTAYGPGAAQCEYVFGDAATRDAFQRLHGEALVRDGWALQAYADRRADQDSVPTGVDRRRRSRD